MTIQAIEPYALPAAEELPENRLHWPLDPARAVLLIHDMQDYFLRFYRADAAPMTDALAHMSALLHACRRADVPVVYSAQPADADAADRKLLRDLWGPGLTAYPEQAAILRELAPTPEELVLVKTRYSAFHRTELAEHMRSLGRDQLWICGVYAHIGCTITAFDAFMHDFKPFLVMDAVMDFSRQEHDLAGKLVSQRCGVVATTARMLAELAQVPNGETSAERLTLAALTELLSLEDTAPDDDLRDLGLDSVRMMELVEVLRDRGLSITSVDLLECQRLDQLIAVVDRCQRLASTERITHAGSGQS